MRISKRDQISFHSTRLILGLQSSLDGYLLLIFKMPITVDEIKQKLQNDIGATYLDIVDTSDGCGAKFQALIVSPQFEGKPLLQRHRLVNTALEAEMKEIHAFQMKTLTPEQWDKQNSG